MFLKQHYNSFENITYHIRIVNKHPKSVSIDQLCVYRVGKSSTNIRSEAVEACTAAAAFVVRDRF